MYSNLAKERRSDSNKLLSHGNVRESGNNERVRVDRN
jgi:hypothetical protein